MIDLISQASKSEPTPALNHDYSGHNFDIDAYIIQEANRFDESSIKDSSASLATAQAPKQESEVGCKREPIGITEITALHQTTNPHFFIAPFLSNKSMQSDTRWITCISTKNITRKECQELGINTQRLRVIRVSTASDILWVTWEALAAGNSQCVLSIMDCVSDEESKQLQNAALLGSCHGLLLTTEKSYRV